MSEADGPEATPSPPPRGCGQAYFLFAVSFCLLITIGTLVQAVSVRIGLIITEIALILTPAVLFVRWKRLPVAEALHWRAVSPKTAALSFLLGVVSWGVAAGIHQLSVPVLGEPPGIPDLVARTFPEYLWILFCAALLPGVCEETLFRGAIQGVLGRQGVRRAVLITAFLFAVFHVNPWIFLPAFFLGVVFGTLAVRTGSSIPAILSHLAANTTAFTVSYLYRDRTDSSAYPLIAILAAGFAVAAPILWNYTRRFKPVPPVLATVPAGMSRPFAWIAGFLGGALVLFLVALVGLGIALVDVYTISSDALEPEFQRGDRVILFRGGFVELDLEVGDIVSYRREGEIVLRKVSRIDADKVWIVEGSAELALPREEITGKAVHTIPVPNE